MLRRLLIVFCLLTAKVVFCGESSPGPVRVMSYNVHNYMVPGVPPKPRESREAVAAVIQSVAPDILVLIELGSAEAMAEIRQMLKDRGLVYPFASLVDGDDEYRKIAVLAKMAPITVKHDVEAFYSLGGRHMLVRRGFAHCIFQWPNEYRLHVIGAHLKSKVFHHLGQTDMRRYEARQLRYLVNQVVEKNEAANVIVLGDMNDTPDSSPISTLCGRRYKSEKELYDLRPLDATGLCWTHLWDDADTYSRIDYAMSSYGLLPEVDFSQTELPFHPLWQVASDHRPVVVTLLPVEKPMRPEILGMFVRNFRKSPSSSEDESEKVIGKRKVRH